MTLPIVVVNIHQSTTTSVLLYAHSPFLPPTEVRVGYRPTSVNALTGLIFALTGPGTQR